MVQENMIENRLEQTWRALCAEYDVKTEMPGIEELFEGAELTRPDHAAERVLFHMLEEISQNVGRFSPFYTLPARSFGMIRVRNSADGRVRWILAPEATLRWCHLLESLGEMIDRNLAVLTAMQVVNGVFEQLPDEDDPCVKAICLCYPQRSVLAHRSMLDSGEVVCNVCGERFNPITWAGV